MRYFTMNIKPNRERWTAFVTEDATERRVTKTLPNVLGFYHFPSTVSKETAFSRLKQRLVKVPPDLLFHSEAVERARQLLVECIRKEGRLESVKFKYLLETTRKFAIPLLDYFDRIGLTRPVGHTRYLKATRKEG